MVHFCWFPPVTVPTKLLQYLHFTPPQKAHTTLHLTDTYLLEVLCTAFCTQNGDIACSLKMNVCYTALLIHNNTPTILYTHSSFSFTVFLAPVFSVFSNKKWRGMKIPTNSSCWWLVVSKNWGWLWPFQHKTWYYFNLLELAPSYCKLFSFFDVQNDFQIAETLNMNNDGFIAEKINGNEFPRFNTVKHSFLPL